MKCLLGNPKEDHIENGNRLFFFAGLPFAALIVAVFIAYAGCYGNAFLYDDDILILQNDFLQSWRFIPALFTHFLGAGSGHPDNPYYRPLQQLLYMFFFQTAGMKPYGFHFLNIALHAANSCLVFRLGQKMKFDKGAAFCAALLWALHPINTEAITYISATADPLYAFFCLSAAIILLPDFSPGRIAWSALFFVLALLAKESAIIFPFLAVGLLYYSQEKRSDFRIYFRLWPFPAIAVFYVILHYIFMPLHGQPVPVVIPSPPPGPDLSSFAKLSLYLKLLGWPDNLYMQHQVKIGLINVVAGFLIVIAAGLQFTLQQTAQTLPLSFGLLWFFSCYVMVAYGGTIAYEHWMYLPAAGLFLGVAQTVFQWLKKKRRDFAPLGPIGIGSMACLLGVLTWQQNNLWHDPAIFYRHVIDEGAPVPWAHINLGVYYVSQDRYQDALDQYELAAKDFDIASDNFTADNRAALHEDIAATLLAMPGAESRQQEALHHLQQAIDSDPNYYPALASLAKFYARHGDAVQSDIYRRRADALRPNEM